MLKRLLILLALNIIMVLSDKKYGSFNLTVTDLEPCRGPKRKECSVIKAQITSRNVIQYDVNVTQSVDLTKGKMIALMNGKDLRGRYLRFHMKKPCEHLILKPILNSVFNITKDCLILKGQYQYNANMEKITQSFFGRSFLLGYWIFKGVFYGDECNFYCLQIKIHF